MAKLSRNMKSQLWDDVSENLKAQYAMEKIKINRKYLLQRKQNEL